MKIALFFALLLIQGSCSQFTNEFVSRLFYGSCSPVKMRPTWLFETLVRKISVPVASGTEVDHTCVNGIPTFTITCDADLYLSDGSQSKTVTCLEEGCPEFENCTAITCEATAVNNANVTELPLSNYQATVNVGCNTDHTLPDGSSTSYTAECQIDGQWSQSDSCMMDFSSAGYKYSPRTGKYYKYMRPSYGIGIRYSSAASTCRGDNANAVVAPPIEPDIIWLLNISLADANQGGWVKAMKADRNSPWMSDGSEITTFYWCATRPEYMGPADGPWCLMVHSCWADRPCRPDTGGVICQLG